MKPTGGPVFPGGMTTPTPSMTATTISPYYNSRTSGAAGSYGSTYATHESGLTIRDQFASHALIGYMLWEGAGAQAQFSPTEIARRCFAVADAMIAERVRE